MTDPPGTPRGRFLVLDGIDGCGKSTQAAALVGWLRECGGEVVHLREPGSTAVGEVLRELLLGRGAPISAGVETLLFAAARRQMLEELVGPALARGAHVVCERFHGSTFAYQAVAGGVGEGRVLELLATWASDPAPDAVLWLDLDVAAALARRGPARDRIEDKGADYQRRVAEGFQRYAAQRPGVVRLDARGPADEVAQRIRREVQRVLA